MRRYLILVVMFGLLALIQCGSDDEPASDQTAKEPVETTEGSVKIPGTRAEIGWIQELTESFKAAKLAYDLNDTSSAIWTAESLLVVAEAAIDTLPPADQMTRFVLIFTSDVYGSLRNWYILSGQPEAATELSQRYDALTQRMQHRRDSVAKMPQ